MDETTNLNPKTNISDDDAATEKMVNQDLSKAVHCLKITRLKPSLVK
jgi:hypothetical protein